MLHQGPVHGGTEEFISPPSCFKDVAYSLLPKLTLCSMAWSANFMFLPEVLMSAHRVLRL